MMIVTKENFLDAFAEMERLAARNGAVIYSIHFCAAGVGINWYEPARVQLSAVRHRPAATENDRWRAGLVTYRYYEDMPTMVQAELDRLKEGGDS